jgi:hypothetical protein
MGELGGRRQWRAAAAPLRLWLALGEAKWEGLKGAAEAGERVEGVSRRGGRGGHRGACRAASPSLGHAAAECCRCATTSRAGARARGQERDDAGAGRAASEAGPKGKPKPTKAKI